jgi:prephenate dehydrogenase
MTVNVAASSFVEKIVLYGVGLINGSLGLALKERGFRGTILGMGRRAETLEQALGRGAIDDYTLDTEKGLAEADLVVVGTPVDVVADVVARLALHADPATIFSDVGSVKACIVASCRERAPSARFVGAHPIAGSERTGVEAARADLFEGAVCILTPPDDRQDDAVEVVAAMWRGVGCRVLTMDAATHDALLAATSHLPHVAAAALVQVIAAASDETQNALQLAGNGYRDTTRIAQGAPELWAPILMGNARHLEPLVRRLARELEHIADALAREDRDRVHQWLAESSRTRGAAFGERANRG